MSERQKNLTRELVRKRVQRHRDKKRGQQEDAGVMLSSDDESIDIDTPSEQQPMLVDSECASSCSGEDIEHDSNDADMLSEAFNMTSSSQDNNSDHNTETLDEQQFQMSPEYDANVNFDSDFSVADIDSSSGDDEDDEYEELELRPASVTEEDVEDLQDFFEDYDETEELRNWALKGNPTIPQTRLDELLAIFRRRLLPNLPKSSKTFLNTSRAKYEIEVNELDKSEFVYFGMSKQLERTVNPCLHNDNIIHLLVNVDGVQLYKSSTKQFWPILCQIFSEENVYKPFPVAIYSGNHKPKDLNKYLEKFVDEINELQAHGLMIDGQRYTLCIKSFICDRPARAFLKAIKNHGAYWGCERCEVRGERVQSRTIYPVDNQTPERTDDSFRQQSNPEHHTGRTPLLDIQTPIDMIGIFVLDFMHLVCLGVMKKLIMLWLKSKLRIRLNYASKMLLSSLLQQLQKQIPCEFQRTTRELTEIERFKAVEFKFLLLYAGPIIFKKVLPESVYRHFLLLHLACRILCSKTKAVVCCVQAKDLLIKFVTLMPRLYGKESLIGNVHSLIHLADDVSRMGCPIFNFTAFPFENSLGRLKRFLRNGNQPLAQICRRLHESFFINCQRVQPEPNLIILRELRPDQTGKIVIKRVKYRNATITTTAPNNTVLLDNGILFEVNHMYLLPGRRDNIQICGTTLKKKGPLFSYPCDSSLLHMWVVSRKNQSLGPYSLSQVVQKMVTLEITNERKRRLYTMPLLHM